MITMLPVPFKLRGRKFDHETRCAGPSLQVRDSQDVNSICEVVGCIGKSNLKFGNPATHGKVFGYQVGIPIGYLAESATSVSRQLLQGQAATYSDRKPLEDWTAHSDASQLGRLSHEVKRSVAQWASFFPALCKESLQDALPADRGSWLFQTIQTIRSKYPYYDYKVPTAVQVLLLQAKEELGALFEPDADAAAFDAIITDDARSQASRLADQTVRPSYKRKSAGSAAEPCTSDASSTESHGSSPFQPRQTLAAGSHESPAIRRMTRVNRGVRLTGLRLNTVTSSHSLDSSPAVPRPCSRGQDAPGASPWFQMVQLPMLQVPALFPQQDPPPTPMHGADYCAGMPLLGFAIPEHGPKRQKLLPSPINPVPEPGSKASATACFMDLLQDSLETGFTFMPVDCAKAQLGASAVPAPQLPEPASPASGISSEGSPLAIRHGCMDAPGFPPQTPCSAPADPTFQPMHAAAFQTSCSVPASTPFQPVHAAASQTPCSASADPTFQPTPMHAANAAALEADLELESDLDGFDVDVDALLDMPAIDGFILPEVEPEVTQGTMPWHTEPESQARSVTPLRVSTPVVLGRASPACILMVPAAFPAADPADGSETISSAHAHKHTVTSGIQGRADRALAFFTQQIRPNSYPGSATTAIPSVGSAAVLSALAVEGMMAGDVPSAAGLGTVGALEAHQVEGNGALDLPVDPLPEADSADFSSFCEAAGFLVP